MKLWKKTTVMLIAFAAVLVLAAIASVAPSGDRGPEVVLPEAPKDAITKIEFLNVEAPFTVEKSGEAWVLKPGDRRVNDKKLDGALDLLSKLSLGSMISKNPAQFQAYEVADEAFTLAVSTSKGEAWRLIVGKETADRRGCYVRLPGDKRVFTTYSRIKSALQTDPKNWRDKTVVSFEKDKAQRITVEAEGRTLAFVKNDKTWAFETPPADLPADFRLDSAKVDKVAQAMSNLSASDFKDNATDLAALGLNPPLVKATVALSEGPPVALLIGKEEDKKCAARRDGADQVYMISSFQKDQIPATLDGYRDMHAAAFNADDAAKVEIMKGKDKIAFSKTDKWQLAEASPEAPAGFILDPVKVDTLVRSASRLEGKTLLGKGAPLGNLQGTLHVTLKDGAIRQFRIGAENDKKEVPVEGDGGFVFLTPQGTAGRLLKKIEDFKVTAQTQNPQQNMFSPEMLDKLPPGLKEQFMQQQKQKIMQNQMLKQMMKKAEKEGADKKK